ncbi:hypothetical protein [Streptomyces sp. NPDC050738]|uniref:hypothetical protein n=1 Tax=Streptomyces sp. NPDC050738 TaxID=3154744 RepID=UPI0034361849
MPDTNDCSLLKSPAKEYCQGGGGGGSSGTGDDGGIVGGASDHVNELVNYLLKKIKGLIAPQHTWAPEKADSWLYGQFMWLGAHLAVAIFICVVVVCGLTAWQGVPRLKQLGTSTGWTLAAVAGMASVPGVVMLLNTAVSNAFTAAFDSDQSTLFQVIQHDLKGSGNPLANLIISSALVVALGFAALVFMTRNPGILAFVLMAPLVLASLARGGDTSAVHKWAQRLLGLMFCPFVLILITPLVPAVRGSLVLEAALLLAADALMLRMVFHGVPYVGPRVAGAARSWVEGRTTNPVARAVVRAGSPDVYEQENRPRMPRMLNTPGRAVHQDRGVLAAAYGLKQQQRSPQLTTQSAISKVQREAPRNQQLLAARQAARKAAQATHPSPRPARPAPNPAPSSNPSAPTPPTNP